jgi:hypothetical protein
MFRHTLQMEWAAAGHVWPDFIFHFPLLLLLLMLDSGLVRQAWSLCLL